VGTEMRATYLCFTWTMTGCDPKYGTPPPIGSPNRFPSNSARSSPFNGKNYADTNPHSYSDDSQRASLFSIERLRRKRGNPLVRPVLI
jgi:hypothetical protein